MAALLLQQMLYGFLLDTIYLYRQWLCTLEKLKIPVLNLAINTGGDPHQNCNVAKQLLKRSMGFERHTHIVCNMYITT